MKDIKETLLLVDDEKINIDILLGLLGEHYDILVALDGYTAIEILQENKIDLILLDILMPDFDGYEVCKKIKEDQSIKNIPIIFITASTDEDSIEQAYEAGGLDYITKPFKPRELLVRIKTQLKVKALIEHLDYIGSYDQMTGIYNRRKFFILAMAAFTQSKEDRKRHV